MGSSVVTNAPPWWGGDSEEGCHSQARDSSVVISPSRRGPSLLPHLTKAVSSIYELPLLLAKAGPAETEDPQGALLGTGVLWGHGLSMKPPWGGYFPTDAVPVDD